MCPPAALGSAVACLGLAAEQEDPERSVSLAQLKPQWELGDKWIVETQSRPVQVREELADQVAIRPIQWQFTVQRVEKTLENDCYRVEVRCLLPGPEQPATVLWIDRKSNALRKLQTQLPVPGGFRTMTENYHFADGQPSPVLAPINALPVDLPLLLGGMVASSSRTLWMLRVLHLLPTRWFAQKVHLARQPLEV